MPLNLLASSIIGRIDFSIVFSFIHVLCTQVCEAMWRGEVSVGGGGEVRLTLPVGAECGGEVQLTLPGILL
jgi:hypothetical protein